MMASDRRRMPFFWCHPDEQFRGFVVAVKSIHARNFPAFIHIMKTLSSFEIHPGTLLITWINYNPCMDKQLHPL